jgi:hypothetical protein
MESPSRANLPEATSGQVMLNAEYTLCKESSEPESLLFAKLVTSMQSGIPCPERWCREN